MKRENYQTQMKVYKRELVKLKKERGIATIVLLLVGFVCPFVWAYNEDCLFQRVEGVSLYADDPMVGLAKTALCALLMAIVLGVFGWLWNKRSIEDVEASMRDLRLQRQQQNAARFDGFSPCHLVAREAYQRPSRPRPAEETSAS